MVLASIQILRRYTLGLSSSNKLEGVCQQIFRKAAPIRELLFESDINYFESIGLRPPITVSCSPLTSMLRFWIDDISHFCILKVSDTSIIAVRKINVHDPNKSRTVNGRIYWCLQHCIHPKISAQMR